MPIQVAGGIGQRAAGVAGVDRRIGLDEILEGVDAELRAAERRDDAHRHLWADAEGVADGEHDVADADAVHAAERDRREARFCRRHAMRNTGEVGFRVAADDRRLQLGPSLRATYDVVGHLDDVEGWSTLAIAADDDAGNEEAGGRCRSFAEAFAEEMPEQRVVHQRIPRLPGVPAS